MWQKLCEFITYDYDEKSQAAGKLNKLDYFLCHVILFFILQKDVLHRLIFTVPEHITSVLKERVWWIF